MHCEEVSGATADIRLFSCPLVASAEAKSPATIKTKKHGCALRRGVGGDRRLRLFSLPPTRARRREFPCLRKRPAMTGSHAVWSRPFGATQHSWSNEQLGGASEDARSYWQGRFAACTFVGFSLWAGRPRNGWGVAPNPTRGAASGLRKGQLPLDPFSRLSWSLFHTSSACCSFILY